MFFNSHLVSKASQVIEILAARNHKISFAESCTGGLLSALFTEIPGSSKAFDRGLITYSNKAKVEMLGVNEKVLAKYGAVSSQTAKEMAIGVIKNSDAGLSVSITGIAGPDGGSKEKPVGLVYICLAKKSGNEIRTLCRKFNFAGNRSQVRMSTLSCVLEMLKSI